MVDKADIKKVLFYLYWEQEKGRMHFCEKNPSNKTWKERKQYVLIFDKTKIIC